VKDTEEILEDLKNDRVPKAGPRYVRLLLAFIHGSYWYSSNTVHVFGILPDYAGCISSKSLLQYDDDKMANL
jgi:hypothetical protein